MTATAVRATLDEATARLGHTGDSPRGDAEVLLAMVLDRPRSWLLARPETPVDPASRQRFDDLVARRVAGHPIAHLIGTREFWSRRFRVTPATLIPRPETEHLIETALARLPTGRPCTIADLGTGSGIIALTLALERPDCVIVATDISAEALAVAQDNGQRLGAERVEFLHSDWFGKLDGRRFDLVASNPPYIARNDPHLGEGDLRFEPALALSAGSSGLEAIEQLITGARDHLLDGGWLILEHGFDQADQVTALLAHHGYTAIESIRDYGGHPRIAAAQWNADT